MPADWPTPFAQRVCRWPPPQIRCGAAGGIRTFAPDLRHGAAANAGGARSRARLISCAVTALCHRFRVTGALRGVRRDRGEIFGRAAPAVAP